jgi:hypothetical protein
MNKSLTKGVGATYVGQHFLGILSQRMTFGMRLIRFPPLGRTFCSLVIKNDEVESIEY